MSNKKPDTFKLRLDQYRRREQLTKWVAAGLGGAVVLLGTNVVEKAPDWLISLIITFVLAGGLGLAMTRVKFEWAAKLIERMIQESEIHPNDPIPAGLEWKWPAGAERWWVLALISITAAGVLIFIAAWWAPISTWLC